MRVLYVPFILQTIVMVVDEFWAHEKRGLPKWERIGHPLDSFTVLIAYLSLMFMPYNETNLWIYVGLASFSCLFITKDEFIHGEHCNRLENWLHSLLFILHPITFFSAGIMWRQGGDPFLMILPIVVGAFLIYQIIRWSILCRKVPT